MIKLEKGAQPQCLEINSESWTRVLLEALAQGRKPTDTESGRYRHPDIKAALVRETYGKCAYCESRLRHIHHGDVEHIYPKSRNPNLSFCWDNLTLSCEICNQNKDTHDPRMDCIIDPYNIDPNEHLLFFGNFVIPIPGSTYGGSTIDILRLDRPELVEVRGEHIMKLKLIFDRIQDRTLPLPARRAIYQDLVERECAPSATYCAMNRSFVNCMKGYLPSEVTN